MKDRMTTEEYRALKTAEQPTLGGIDRTNHSNLGKEFERELSRLHDFYRDKKMIDIVQNLNSWDYPRTKYDFDKTVRNYQAGGRSAAKTGDGRFLMCIYSDVDFSGGGNDLTVLFDAKETKGKSFPLASIAGHQVHRLVKAKSCGTVAFALVKFTELDRVFFIDADYLNTAFELWEISKAKHTRAQPGTASISLAEFCDFGREIFRDGKNGLWDWYEVLITPKQ